MSLDIKEKETPEYSPVTPAIWEKIWQAFEADPKLDKIYACEQGRLATIYRPIEGKVVVEGFFSPRKSFSREELPQEIFIRLRTLADLQIPAPPLPEGEEARKTIEEGTRRRAGLILI